MLTMNRKGKIGGFPPMESNFPPLLGSVASYHHDLVTVFLAVLLESVTGLLVNVTLYFCFYGSTGDTNGYGE